MTNKIKENNRMHLERLVSRAHAVYIELVKSFSTKSVSTGKFSASLTSQKLLSEKQSGACGKFPLRTVTDCNLQSAKKATRNH